MAGSSKIHKVGINLGGNDLIRPKLDTTTLLTTGEIGFTGTYVKFYSGGVERAIGGTSVNALRLNEFANPTGSVDLNSQKIINLGTPTSNTDAVNKSYVDALVTGLDIKNSVRATTTAPLPTCTYANGSGGVGATLTGDVNGALTAQDGITLVVDDRLLVKNQSSTLENGIYKVTQIGDGSNPFILTRTTDTDNSPSGEVTAGMFTLAEAGTQNASTGWVLTTTGSITIGTTGLTFTQFSSSGNLTAGAGLTLTLTTLDVVSANTGIVVNANDIELSLATNSGLEISSGLKIASTVAGNGLTLTSGVLAVGAGDGISVASDTVSVASTIAGNGLTYTTGVLDVGAGTGITVNTNDVVVNTSVVARKHVDTTTVTGNGSTTDFTITHGLSNQWVSVTVINETTLEDEVVDIERTNTTTCTVKFAVAPAIGENYTVLVIG